MDPPSSCSSSLGDCADPPFSLTVSDGEVGMFEARLFVPRMVSKSGLVVSERKRRRSCIRNETLACF